MNNNYIKKIMPDHLKRAYSLSKVLILILLLVSSFNVSAQIKISGVVKDSRGESLPGVSVKIKGSQNGGTQTDANGNYSINVSNANEVLIFSYLGFLTQEKSIEGKNEVSIILHENINDLDEVIVVGYGVQKKRDVTGAISSVSSQDIEKRQPIDVFDALQGQAAGVQIAQESGRPGAGNSIRIRGTATLEGGADPLYIVDGAQGVNIDGINPSDIESIEILKDAASAAIYGARSANGVVIITTKKGVEGKPRIAVNYLQSFSNLAHKIPQANADQRRLYMVKRSGAESITIDSLNPSFNADNDMQDLLTRTGIRNQLDISASGGSKNLSFYGSFGYLRDEGIILNSYANIARARFNIDYRPTKKFTYVSRIQFSYQDENRIDEGNTLNQAIQRPPAFRVYLPDGTLAGTLGGRRNPVAYALLRKNEFDIYDANIYNAFSYDILKDLKFTTDANIRAGYTHNLVFNPKLIGDGVTNSGSDATDFRTYWQVQSYLNYNKTIATDHSFTGVLGVAADKDFRRGADLSGSNYVSETVLTLNSAQLLNQASTSTDETQNTSASAFGRLGYSYKGKYLFNSNFRLDGASRFGKDNRWGFFPSASVGWRLSQENFMEWTKPVLEDAKLRISYGETGNDRIDNYASVQRYVFGTTYYNNVSGVVQNSQFGNNRLSWESTSQLDFGIDLSFLKGRISFVADYYNKITNDLLYKAPLSYETGYNTVQVNIGSIQNKGFEFMINAIPISKEDFNWNVSYNMAFNNNTIRELYEGIPILPGNGRWKIDEGGKLGNFFGWKALGVYQYDVSNAYTESWERLEPVGVSADGKTAQGYTLNGQPYTGNINQLTTQGNISKGGDVIWENTTKDGVIDDNDKVILGNAQPKFIAGLANSFSYKNLSLSFNFYVSWGNQLYSKARQGLNNFGTTNVTPEVDAIIGAWDKPGDITNWPIAKNNSMGNVREVNSNYIEDASFIRLRNMKLSYNLPKDISSRFKMENLGVYVYGTNLLTWTNYKWYDPEISLGNALEMGQDNGRYPREREFGLGLNINF